MEVRCWCCEHYPYLNVNFGMCDLKNKTVAALDNVCEHFQRKAGLRFYTELSSCGKNCEENQTELEIPERAYGIELSFDKKY
ncbi:MAG: hypothetical protein IJ462_02970 [Clostridia bacterium]|nr:hypothetical protein [Clostridia bacterium]